jgi:pyrroline-5-carboxylate reductase
VNKIIKEIEAIFNRSGLTANIEIKELNIMLGLSGCGIIYIMETFPLEFFDLISNFDFL